jgi:hypothetical protein
MRIVVDRSCFLETSIYTSSGDKLKIVVLLSRVERHKILGEIVVNSQLVVSFQSTLQPCFSFRFSTSKQ